MARKKATTKSAARAKHARTKTTSPSKTKSHQPRSKSADPDAYLRSYTIRDYRLEKPSFTLRQIRAGDTLRYELESGDLSAPPPPIRESKYLSREQCIEIYRWMLLNRRMETALENLYKQGKVVGGVYFGLGQEACSCASAYALRKDDWLGPMIRNQGSLLVRGFSPADIMMQYMAKAGSPTEGYYAGHKACERARRGQGPTLIEAKMMRMKGHAIHDAAEYVPKPLFEYWKKRDPIARFQDYLVKDKKWLSPAENEKLIAGVERQLEADRELAVNSPMPSPESAADGVYCEAGCHEIKPKYAMPWSAKIGARGGEPASPKPSEAAVHLK